MGNADPRAMQVAIAAWDCFTRVGPAEGERAIAQAIVYLACAPKSNAVYTAFKAALADARERPDYDVPVHLRNAPTKLMKEMGYGQSTAMPTMSPMPMLRVKCTSAGNRANALLSSDKSWSGRQDWRKARPAG